ncbi:opioid growth factor receptor-like protein 1 [Astatotilapia calliptera]|uniref:Opioid growth factor receptor (OGFr) conserved domain-containing protein n=1 Tax=Astatotilapia calliptera TaxID=8154 RepID=A0AAX7W076_ASTCA|nr:opioid growth factor receptor-like protein 1 [Astatotilapia calliptera]
MAWFRNKSSASPDSTLDRKVDRNESKTSTENEDSFRSLSEDAEGDVSEGQHEADEGRESGRKLPGPEEEEFDSREHGAGTTVGYSGFRSLRDWIVRRTQMVFGPLTFSKKDRNESETSDDNTRALKNSPDDAERVISPELKRSSDNGEEPETKWTRSNQDNFQNDRVETVDENVSMVHPNESEMRTENAVDEGKKLTGPEEEEEEFDSTEYRVHTTDEFYCDYDSTWETDPNEESPPSRIRQSTNSNYYNFSRFERAARDMQNYRHDYPSQIKTQHRKKNTNDDKSNLNFYLGKKRSVPDGVSITEFHEQWYGDYESLEYVHTYIQWLFPLQDPGVNYEASTLTKEEITDFCNHSLAQENLVKSYKLMLDFYGIVLCDEKTGEVRRAKHWEERFDNLNSHTHNSLRITRILKCLGNLGYRHYQAPLVRFFLEETLVNGQLPNIRDSVLSYFMFAVLDKKKRRGLIKYAYLNYEPKDEFVWCPKKIQKLWSMQPKAAKEEAADSLESQEDTVISDSEAQEEENLSEDESCNNAEYESHEGEETFSHNED